MYAPSKQMRDKMWFLELTEQEIKKNIKNRCKELDEFDLQIMEFQGLSKQEQLERKELFILEALSHKPNFNHYKKDYDDGKTAGAVNGAVSEMVDIFQSITGEDLSWVEQYISETLFKKRELEIEQYTLGACVSHLVYWGCSKNQAIKSIAEWLLISETKVRDAYYSLDKTTGVNWEYENADYAFSIGKLNSMIFGEIRTRPFPKTYERAHRALVLGGLAVFDSTMRMFSSRPYVKIVYSPDMMCEDVSKLYNSINEALMVKADGKYLSPQDELIYDLAESQRMSLQESFAKFKDIAGLE